MSVHCVAHRLALALGGSAQLVPRVKLVIETLDSVSPYFDNSPMRTGRLRAVQILELSSSSTK